MNDILGMVVALAAITIGLAVGLYRLGWWRGYNAAQEEFLDNLKRQEGKNWYSLMKERMQKEEADGKR